MRTLNESDRYRTVSAEQLLKIAKVQKVMKQEEDEVARHQMLRDVMREELAYQIRQNVCYPWAEYYIEDAHRWLSMRKKKLDKRRRYDERASYNQLCTHLAKAFQVDTVEILDITYWGFQTFGYTVIFRTDEDFTWILGIPKISEVTPKNMEESNYGQIKFGYMQNSSCYYYVKSSYTLSDFAKTMQECIANVDGDYTIHLSIQEYLTKEE